MLADGTAVCIRTFCCAKAVFAEPMNASATSAPNAFLSIVALHDRDTKPPTFMRSTQANSHPSHAAGILGSPASDDWKKPNDLRATTTKVFAIPARGHSISLAAATGSGKKGHRNGGQDHQ